MLDFDIIKPIFKVEHSERKDRKREGKMSNITFIIGNGFDRQLGLDTGYDQFLSWYIQQLSSSENIKTYKEYLKNNPQSPWWSDAEIAMGAYIKQFTDMTISFYYEQIRDLKLRLAEYLQAQQARCDYSNKAAIASAFAGFVANFHKDILLDRKVSGKFSQRESTNYYFITFNYTSVLNDIISITKTHLPAIYSTRIAQNFTAIGQIAEVIPVHGTLQSSLIMGVNDESQIQFPGDYLTFTPKLKRTIIKPQTNSALGRSEDARAEAIIKNSNVIAIYGLKLGDTDKKWRDYIAEWFRIDSHYITIFDHIKLEGASKLIPEDILDYVEEKQNQFLRHLYPDITEDQIEQIRDRVFVIDRTSYLDINILSDRNPQADDIPENI